jgi:hypothetical protein
MQSWLGYICVKSQPHLHNLQLVATKNLSTLPYELPHNNHCLASFSQGLGQLGVLQAP